MFFACQFEFNWPSYVVQLLTSQKLIIMSEDSLFSVNCYAESETSSNSVDSYYYKLILVSLIPIIVFIFSFTVGLVYAYTMKPIRI